MKSSDTPSHASSHFLFEQIDDECVVYDLESSDAHLLNPAAATVWGLMDGERSSKTVVSMAVAAGVAAQDAEAALLELGRRGLAVGVTAAVDGLVSRRTVLKASAAAAIAAPFVTTLLASPAAAASCGANCTTAALDCAANGSPCPMCCAGNATAQKKCVSAAAASGQTCL